MTWEEDYGKTIGAFPGEHYMNGTDIRGKKVQAGTYFLVYLSLMGNKEVSG